MPTIQTFHPRKSSRGSALNYWTSHSTNHSFKRPGDFDGWELSTLRTFDRELCDEIATLNENKSQIIRDKTASGAPAKSYVHDVARIENRRRFLLKLRTGVESAMRSHPERIAIRKEKRYVHCLQEACKELLSPEQCKTVMELAEQKNALVLKKYV